MAKGTVRRLRHSLAFLLTFGILLGMLQGTALAGEAPPSEDSAAAEETVPPVDSSPEDVQAVPQEPDAAEEAPDAQDGPGTPDGGEIPDDSGSPGEEGPQEDHPLPGGGEMPEEPPSPDEDGARENRPLPDGEGTLVVYLDGTNGDDANSGSDKEHAVKSLEKAYELAASGSIAADSSAEAVILLCGETTFCVNPSSGKAANFNIPSSGKAAISHAGTLILTSRYGGEDYSGTAALSISSNTADRYVQMGGPTVLEHMTLDVSRSSAGVYFYVGTDFTVAETVETRGVTSSDSLVVCGGWCREDESQPIRIQLLGGTYGAVCPVPFAKTHGWTTGSCDITIGSAAEAMKIQAGPLAQKSASHTIERVSVTLEAGAQVGKYCAGCADGAFGQVAESTLVLEDGAVPQFSTAVSGTVGVTHLVLSGLTGEFDPSGGNWTKLTVQDGSDVGMLAFLPEDLILEVETGSTVTLAAGDSHAHTGGGDVITSSAHVWTEEEHRRIPSTCSRQGMAYYTCSDCGLTKEEILPLAEHALSDGVCGVCGGRSDTIYVMDGGTGDGYTPRSAAGNLEEAYQSLVDRAGLADAADSLGTVVICGKTTVDTQWNYTGSIAHAGTVVFTSACSGVDYRGGGAALLLCAAGKGDLGGDEHRFVLGGPAIFRDITIDRGGSDVHLTIYAPVSLVVEESVQMVNGYWQLDSTAPPQPGLSDQEIASIVLSAHRGYQPMAPENSYPSFIAAGELGYGYIETDARLTKDGYLVCIHDNTIDRTYNGSGAVEEMTLAELRQHRIDTAKYDVDLSQFDDDELQIPLFSEYLAICRKYGAKPFIETKSDLEGEALEAYVGQVIREALDAGFAEEEIVISSGTPSHLTAARKISTKLFVHDIWVAGVDFMAALNTNGGDYRDSNAGIAFNVSGLQTAANYAKAAELVREAHSAGLQVCLRAGDDLETVRIMQELGLDYIPTNVTHPAMLQGLKAGAVGGNRFTETGAKGKLFIRGGTRSQHVTNDVSITLLSGMYDMLADSNAEKTTSGDGHITVGGNAYAAVLVAGETNSKASGIRKSLVTIQDDAVVDALYTAGDYGSSTEVSVALSGRCRVGELSGHRSNKKGTVQDVTLTVSDPILIPPAVSLSAGTGVTGTQTLRLAGGGLLLSGGSWNRITAEDGAAVTLLCEYPLPEEFSHLCAEGSGRFLVSPGFQFGALQPIAVDGEPVELGTDIPYSMRAPSALQVSWYADNSGARGQALSGAPSAAGYYWVGVAAAETPTDTAGVWYAGEEQYLRFEMTGSVPPPVRPVPPELPPTPGRPSDKPAGKDPADDPPKDTTPTAPQETPDTDVKMPAEAVFTDVHAEDWFCGSVQYVYSRGLMTGTSSTNFSPEAPVSRAMVMVVLARLAGEDTQGGSPWYAAAQAWAVAQKISDGTRPEAQMTREMLAAMLYRYAGSPDTAGSLAAFRDADETSSWAVNAMRWAVEQGLMYGEGGGVLNPRGGATRAELAAILTRFCETYRI